MRWYSAGCVVTAFLCLPACSSSASRIGSDKFVCAGSCANTLDKAVFQCTTKANSNRQKGELAFQNCLAAYGYVDRGFLTRQTASTQPNRSVAKEEPKRSVAEEEPKRSVVKNVPKRSVVKEEPKRSVVKEEPKRSVVKEEPKRSVAKEEPKRSVAKEEPKRSVVNKHLIRSIVDKEPIPSIVNRKSKQNATKKERPATIQQVLPLPIDPEDPEEFDPQGLFRKPPEPS